MVFGLSSLSLNLSGSLGSGTVTGGSLIVAAIEPADSGVDGRSWVAALGTDLGATISLGSSISVAVSDVSLQINQASGTGPDGSSAPALNWAKDISLNGGTTYGGTSNEAAANGQSITFPTELVSLSGELSSINIFNLIKGSWTTATNPPELRSPSRRSTCRSRVAPATLTGATLVTLALANLQASAGAGRFGVSVTGGAVGLAVLDAPSGDGTAQWVAVDAANFSASLSLSANVTAALSGVSVTINQASGSYTPSGGSSTAAQPLNWTADLDLTGDNQFGTAADQVNPGANLPTPIALPINFTAGRVHPGRHALKP